MEMRTIHTGGHFVPYVPAMLEQEWQQMMSQYKLICDKYSTGTGSLLQKLLTWASWVSWYSAYAPSWITTKASTLEWLFTGWKGTCKVHVTWAKPQGGPCLLQVGVQHVQFDNQLPTKLWIFSILVQGLHKANQQPCGEHSISWFAGIGSVSGTVSFSVRWVHNAYMLGGGGGLFLLSVSEKTKTGSTSRPRLIWMIR